MDIGKFLQPLQSLSGYIVSRTVSFILTIVIVWIVVPAHEFRLSYALTALNTFIDEIVRSFGLGNGDRPIILGAFLAFSFYLVVEAHGAVLVTANKFMPFRFGYSGGYNPLAVDDTTYILWCGYANVLNFEDFRRCMRIYVDRYLMDQSPQSWSTTTEDYLPGYLVILFVTLIADLFGYIDINWWKCFLIFIIISIWWFIYQYKVNSRQIIDALDAKNKAAIALIEKRFHDPIKLTEQQRSEVEGFLRHNRGISTQRVYITVPLWFWGREIWKSLRRPEDKNGSFNHRGRSNDNFVAFIRSLKALVGLKP